MVGQRIRGDAQYSKNKYNAITHGEMWRYNCDKSSKMKMLYGGVMFPGGVMKKTNLAYTMFYIKLRLHWLQKQFNLFFSKTLWNISKHNSFYQKIFSGNMYRHIFKQCSLKLCFSCMTTNDNYGFTADKCQIVLRFLFSKVWQYIGIHLTMFPYCGNLLWKCVRNLLKTFKYLLRSQSSCP